MRVRGAVLCAEMQRVCRARVLKQITEDTVGCGARHAGTAAREGDRKSGGVAGLPRARATWWQAGALECSVPRPPAVPAFRWPLALALTRAATPPVCRRPPPGRELMDSVAKFCETAEDFADVIAAAVRTADF